MCRVLDQETALLKKIPPPQIQIVFTRIITLIQVRVWLQILVEKGEAGLSKYGAEETPSSSKAACKWLWSVSQRDSKSLQSTDTVQKYKRNCHMHPPSYDIISLVLEGISLDQNRVF